MRQHNGVKPLPLLIALCGIAFCVWSALGNGLSFCVTQGCALFQDVSINGVSLWWVGAGAFGFLAVLALAGRARFGAFCAGICLCLDIVLLAIMMLTAPCVSCLLAACFFAFTYMGFLQAVKSQSGKTSRSYLLWVWFALLCVNVGTVAKAEVNPWRMAGSQEDTVRLYFSPSCSACREAVTALSGRVNVGFYPVLEEDTDLFKIQDMLKSLKRGDNMAEAMAKAQGVKAGSPWTYANLDNFLLWFRLMRNKAHVMDADSLTVPFLEFQGLPASLTQGRVSTMREGHNAHVPSPGAGAMPTDKANTTATSPNMDFSLPIDTDIAGACGKPGAKPCPEFELP